MGECLVFPSLNGGDDSPLIPEGKYEMSYVSHATWRFMGKQPKVVIYFSIVDPGYIGVIVPAYYNVISTTGKPGKNGRFKTAKKSNLVRDYYSIFPNESLSRFDRLPLTNLKNVIVHILVVLLLLISEGNSQIAFNSDGYFEAPGFRFLVYQNETLGMRLGGLEMILHQKIGHILWSKQAPRNDMRRLCCQHMAHTVKPCVLP